MRRVFNYNEYLNESMKKEAKDALINSFLTALSEVLLAHDWLESYNAHSRFFKAGDSFDDRYKIVISDLNKAGWTNEALENLFMDHGDDIAEIYNTANPDEIRPHIVSDNEEVVNVLPIGTADYVLYKLTHGKVWLSGYRPSESDFEEKYIRFGYGYATKYKYGQMAIVQDFGSLSHYIDVLGKEFPKLFNPENRGLGFLYISSAQDFKVVTESQVADNYKYSEGIGTWNIESLLDDGIEIKDIKELLEMNLGLRIKYDEQTNDITMYWNHKLKD